MAIFTDVYDATVANTKRPELVALTKTCVKLATMRAHHVDFFVRDQALIPVSYTINNSSPIVTVSGLYTTAPQMRAIDFVQSLDVSTGLPSESFDWREYKDFWNVDGELRRSVYTQVGESLILVPAVQTGSLQLSVYNNPVTTEASYSSWIADSHLDEIAMWAAGLVWARTGFLEQARVVQDLHVTPFKELLVESYLTSTVN